MDTNWTRNPTADFRGTNFRMQFCDGQWTHLYNPTDEAKAWDGVVDCNYAVGSRFGFYSYVRVKVTGRKVRYEAPGLRGTPALKVRVTVGLGTGEPSDEETVDAFLIGRYQDLHGLIGG